MDQETIKLVKNLANALLDTVSLLEDAQDTFQEGAYPDEMALYDQAMEWLDHNA